MVLKKIKTEVKNQKISQNWFNQFKPINIFSKNEKILDLQVWGGKR